MVLFYPLFVIIYPLMFSIRRLMCFRNHRFHHKLGIKAEHRPAWLSIEYSLVFIHNEVIIGINDRKYNLTNLMYMNILYIMLYYLISYYIYLYISNYVTA